MRRRLAALAIGMAGLAVASACTTTRWDTSQVDDTTPTTAKRYPRTAAGVSESLAAHLSAVGDDLDEWAAPRDQARCAAERLVHRFGAERLLDLGYDPQKPTLALGYSPEERTAAINVLVGCVDFREAVLELISSYLKLPVTQANCVAEGFERLGLVRDMAGALVDGTEADPFANGNRVGGGLSSLAQSCMEETDLSPAAPLPPLPGPAPGAPTTSAPSGGTTELPGIVPGGPLDTSTTTP